MIFSNEELAALALWICQSYTRFIHQCTLVYLSFPVRTIGRNLVFVDCSPLRTQNLAKEGLQLHWRLTTYRDRWHYRQQPVPFFKSEVIVSRTGVISLASLAFGSLAEKKNVLTHTYYHM